MKDSRKVVYIDKDEEAPMNNVSEKINMAEQKEFFKWLSNTVAAEMLKQIQDSYVQINVLLIKSKALPRVLTDISTVKEVDFALQRAKKTFANKRLRNIAFHLLSSYISYLQEEQRKRNESENLSLIHI